MTNQNRLTIDKMYAAFGSQDLQTALSTVTENTLWIHHGTTKMPGMRFEGKQAVGKFFQMFFKAKFDYFRPLIFVESDDKVVVQGEESFTTVEQGTLSNKWVQVYTLENGLISKLDEFSTSLDDKDYQVIV